MRPLQVDTARRLTPSEELYCIRNCGGKENVSFWASFSRIWWPPNSPDL